MLSSGANVIILD